MRGDRSGFTLIELIVVIAMLGLILLGIRSMLHAMMDSEDRLSTRARDAERAGVGERQLRDVLGRVTMVSTGDANFSGDADEMRFRTWCESAYGWLERCELLLTRRRTARGSAIVASVDGTTLGSWLTAPDLELRYLDGALEAGRWLPGWGRAVDLPRAVGFVRPGDTLVVPVGAR